jgi:hypothetical protein
VRSASMKSANTWHVLPAQGKCESMAHASTAHVPAQGECLSVDGKRTAGGNAGTIRLVAWRRAREASTCVTEASDLLTSERAPAHT